MYRSSSAPVGPDVAHASSQVEYVMAPIEYLLLPPTQYSESVSPQAVPPSPPIHPQHPIHHLNTTSPQNQHVQFPLCSAPVCVSCDPTPDSTCSVSCPSPVKLSYKLLIDIVVSRFTCASIF